MSMSTSGGSAAGSPSETMKAALAEGNARLSHLDIHGDGDEAGSRSQTPILINKKKRAVGGENRGLRQFSMKVCEKVETKGTTTYNQVADELVAEFSGPSNNFTPPDQHQDEEKNIRRRVYDALNVLMAMDIISKDKKEIHWKGLPRTTLNDIEELKTERAGLKRNIEKKASYLQELEEQYIGLQNLIQRNEQLYGSGNAPTGGVALPFILVQTRPHATVEVEISEDMQLVHFDFNSTPFKLHYDNYVLKEMRFCERQQGEVGTHDSSTKGDECTENGGKSSSMLETVQPCIPLPLSSNAAGRASTSPPLPGILKAHVKHEH